MASPGRHCGQDARAPGAIHPGARASRRLSFLALLLCLAVAGQAAAATAPAGASACSGCHATQATLTTVPRLIGRDPAEIVAAMEDFKAGRRPATVMDRVAKGFSDDEIKAIASWYGAQK